MRFPQIVTVEAVGFADAWQQLIAECLDKGKIKLRLYGKPVRTRDIVSLTTIDAPETMPMLHPSFPSKEKHLEEYCKQFERGYDWKKQGFEYTYLDRLTNYNGIDQLRILKERIAAMIKSGGECYVSNRDVAITWQPDLDLFIPEDQPCLQRVQVFVYRFPDDNEYGIGEYHLTWRSRDGFAAWNSNMIAIYQMMKREIFEPNKIKIGRVVDFCNSFHIYMADWEAASNIKPISLNLSRQQYD